jgi:hypothetical protein
MKKVFAEYAFLQFEAENKKKYELAIKKRKDDIRDAKTWLTTLGYFKGEINNVFDHNDELISAVEHFLQSTSISSGKKRSIQVKVDFRTLPDELLTLLKSQIEGQGVALGNQAEEVAAKKAYASQ